MLEGVGTSEEPASQPQHEFIINNDSFVTFHGGVDGLKHKVVDPHTLRKMEGNNVNRRRDSLLFFPYISLPQHWRKGLPPRGALEQILKALQEKGLYVDGRWRHEETFANRSPEDGVAQFFQTIQEVACDWATCDSNTLNTYWKDHSITLIENLRKPDVVLLPTGSKSDIAFKDVLTYCELKASFNGDTQKEALKQLTEIAGYVSACQLNRRFYIASSLCDRQFTLAAFIRGSTVISEPINIDSSPIPFLSAVLGLSRASATWCGFDFSMSPGPSNTYKLSRSFCSFAKVTLGGTLLHAATDMHGKGTKVPLCEVWKQFGVTPKTYPIKMAWMATVLQVPGSSTDGMRLPNDIDISKLLEERAPHFPSLQGQQKRIFGKEDVYKIFTDCLMPPRDDPEAPTWDYMKHWPGITIFLPEDCERPGAPCPSPDPSLWENGYYPDNYTPPICQDTTRNILERFNVPLRLHGKKVNGNWEPQDEEAVFASPSLCGETRELIWVLYRSCGTSMVWFSCRREFLNGILGALSGHFNALMMKIQHCDISDTNVMFLVNDASPEAVVPNWPKDQDAYPKRPGMLGDWGYAADLKGNPVVRRMTGTFPYIATAFLSQEAKTLAHTVHHDLESFFWVLWIVCVNMNGPYYTRRRWQDEDKTKKKSSPSSNLGTPATSYSYASTTTMSYNSFATTQVSSSSVTGVSTPWTAITESPTFFTISPLLSSSKQTPTPLQRQDTFREQPWREPEEIISVTTRLPKGEDDAEKHAPPIWATPGRHNLGRLDVFRSKHTLPESLFIDSISPYFRQSGSGFVDGLKTLHDYFVKSQEPGGEQLREQIGEITHEKFCDIVKSMLDSIPADLDRTSDADIINARERYRELLTGGGNHGISISVLDSSKPRRAKRRAEDENSSKVPRKRSSKSPSVKR